MLCTMHVFGIHIAAYRRPVPVLRVTTRVQRVYCKTSQPSSYILPMILLKYVLSARLIVFRSAFLMSNRLAAKVSGDFGCLCLALCFVTCSLYSVTAIPVMAASGMSNPWQLASALRTCRKCYRCCMYVCMYTYKKFVCVCMHACMYVCGYLLFNNNIDSVNNMPYISSKTPTTTAASATTERTSTSG